MEAIVAGLAKGDDSVPPMQLLSRCDLLSRPDPTFLIEGMLLEFGVSMLWGDTNIGKTLVSLDLAACVATGQPFLEHDTRESTVVYVVAEGFGDFKWRVNAWESLNEQRLTDRMWFLEHPIQLADDASIDELVRAVAALELEPGLIVIDTLARCFLGQDENSSRDAGRPIAGCQRLQKELNSAVLLVHHCGKGERPTIEALLHSKVLLTPS